MPHRILIVGIFLLAGLVVNVAVAWGLSLRSWPFAEKYGQRQLTPDQKAIDWWRKHAVLGFPDTPAAMHTLHRFGYRSLRLYENVDSQKSLFAAYARADGWPMVSLESQHWVKRAATDQCWGVVLAGSPLPAGTHRELPILPLWPGFYVNSIAYAGVLWLLVTGIRAHFRDHSRCPACGYPIGDLPVCTECGKPLPKRRRPPNGAALSSESVP